MSFGSTEMYSALNVSAITDLLDTYVSNPAIFDDVVIPQDFTDEKSINYSFLSESPNEVKIYNYIINCRAQTLNVSRTIAQTVIDTISRENGLLNGTKYSIYATITATIGPFDDRDNYNTPVDAVLKLT